MAYTKLDAGITDSTVWATPDSTRLTWITMLAMADQHGYVGASIPGLASRARVTIEGCLAALECFKSPDPYSRTKDFEGRRIADADGGWVLLNHAKYRAKQSEDDRRERSRLAMAKLRADRKQREQAANSCRVLTQLTSVVGELSQAEADTEATPKTISTPVGVSPRKRGSSGCEGFDLFWMAYPRKTAKAAALNAFTKLSPSAELLDEMLHAIAKQRMSAEWTRDGGAYIPHPATWINGKRWEDEGTDMPATAHETPRQKAAIDRVIEMTGGLLNARQQASTQEYIDANWNEFTEVGGCVVLENGGSLR